MVLSTTFQFRLGDLGPPVQYAELAGALGIDIGERAPARDVREAVLDLRRRKAMVLDAADHDTWSTGSFFTNPVVPADVVPDGAPTWPQPDGLVKTSAAWLIEHAGFTKGYGNDRVRLSSRHTLAITNRGGGHHGGAARARPRDPGGRAGEVRDHAGQRARARRLPALSPRRRC